MKLPKLLTVVKLVGCVVVAIVMVFILERCFMVAHEIYNPTNPFLLPDTFRENMRQETEKNQMKMFATESVRLWKELDGIKKKFKEESKISQSEKMLILRQKVDKLFDKVVEMKNLSQQLQEKSEVADLGNELGFLWGEFAEIHEQLQKLQNAETPASLAPP